MLRCYVFHHLLLLLLADPLRAFRLGRGPLIKRYTSNSINNGASYINDVEPSLEGKKSKVLLIYTGGTMGMKKDEFGSLLPAPGYLTEQIGKLPEMMGEEMPLCMIKEYTTLVDSSDFSPEIWKSLAHDIHDYYFDFDGFVIVMGTDTMAYATSALSFMLEHLGKPVIFTGSMIPFFEPYTDARRNLIVSMLLAGNLDIPEVCLYFNSLLLRGNRAIKMDNFNIDAFCSPNFPPLATLGTGIQVREDLLCTAPKRALRLHLNMEANILVVRLVPGFRDSAIDSIVTHTPDLKALVLESYGTGNAPSSRKELLDIIKKAINKSILVMITSQCEKGSVALENYTVGRKLLELGVISAGDMTTEATVTKLAYVLGSRSYVNFPERVQAMQSNLRGELSVQKISPNKLSR